MKKKICAQFLLGAAFPRKMGLGCTLHLSTHTQNILPQIKYKQKRKISAGSSPSLNCSTDSQPGNKQKQTISKIEHGDQNHLHFSFS